MPQTSIVEITAFYLIYEIQEDVLRVNKSEIIGKNSFNGDYFEIETKYYWNKDEETLFWVFLQI